MTENHSSEEASKLAGFATIAGSLEDGELSNHETPIAANGSAATYWEMELGSIAVVDAEPVKLKLQTEYTSTKWLSLTPAQFVRLAAFLVSIEDAEPRQEHFSKFAAVQASIRAGYLLRDRFIACTGNSETGEFRITTTGEPFSVQLTRNADRTITATKIEG